MQDTKGASFTVWMEAGHIHGYPDEYVQAIDRHPMEHLSKLLAEAKALGIKMGQPYFQIKALCRRENVAVFSSNYVLYGDMSRRMNAVYERFSPDVEIYSIDESFLELSRLAIPDG